MEPGSVADWVNAVGTLLAFLGASFAALIAMRSYRAQREQTHEQLARSEQELARRNVLEEVEQAKHVAVWAVRTATRWHVNIVNRSDLPVYEMAVRFSAGERFDVHVVRGVQGPTDTKRSDMLTMSLRALLPAEFVGEITGSSPGLDVECVFTDASGVRWHRDVSGRLHKVPTEYSLPGTPLSQQQLFLQYSELYRESRRAGDD